MATKAQTKAAKAAPAAEQAPIVPAASETAPVATVEAIAPTAVPDATVAPIEPPAPPAVPFIDPPIVSAAVPKLRDYIREHEDAAEALGVVVAQITHPDAPGDVMQGRYSGIRATEGNPSATYSDGSKH